MLLAMFLASALVFLIMCWALMSHVRSLHPMRRAAWVPTTTDTILVVISFCVMVATGISLIARAF